MSWVCSHLRYGGVIQGLFSKEKVKVTIIARDIDGAEEEDLKAVLGSEAYVYSGIDVAEIDLETIKEIEEDLKKNETAH